MDNEPLYLVNPHIAKRQQRRIGKIVNAFGEFDPANPRWSANATAYIALTLGLASAACSLAVLGYFILGTICVVLEAICLGALLVHHFRYVPWRCQARLDRAVVSGVVLRIPPRVWSLYSSLCREHAYNAMITDFIPFFVMLRDETLPAAKLRADGEAPLKVRQDLACIVKRQLHTRKAKMAKYPPLD